MKHCGRRGVAARVLELEQQIEKYTGRVTYTVMLEGWCRFSVGDLTSNGFYKSAQVTQLDRNKAGMCTQGFDTCVFKTPWQGV